VIFWGISPHFAYAGHTDPVSGCPPFFQVDQRQHRKGAIGILEQATITRFGTTENAVKTQIWIAISVYVLVAIVKKRLKTDASLYKILQILSLTLFEKAPFDQLLKSIDYEMPKSQNDNQMNLFN